jgi:hypothetical protein
VLPVQRLLVPQTFPSGQIFALENQQVVGLQLVDLPQIPGSMRTVQVDHLQVQALQLVPDSFQWLLEVKLMDQLFVRHR